MTATTDNTIDLPDTLSATELLLLSLEHRFGRIATALEGTAAAAKNIDGLTAQVSRLADAFSSIAETLSCLTETVEGQDGQSRCTLRTHKMSPGLLSMFEGELQ
jgi:hypothetical protein